MNFKLLMPAKPKSSQSEAVNDQNSEVVTEETPQLEKSQPELSGQDANKEYLSILGKFTEFLPFLDSVAPYIAAKSSPLHTLRNKLHLVSGKQLDVTKSDEWGLSYSEVATLRKAVGAILQLLRGSGVKLPRKVTGGINDDLDWLEETTLVFAPDDDVPNTNGDPFSNWLEH